MKPPLFLENIYAFRISLRRQGLIFAVVATLAPILFGCQKEKKVYQYELEEVRVGAQTAVKNKPKSDLEVVSVAYTDIFAQTIPNELLNRLSNFYAGFGDKSTAIEIITRNGVNNERAIIPGAESMRSDPEKFVEETYKKFYIRRPGEYEKQFWVEKIRNDSTLTPKIVYYTFMTSKEYKFY